MREKLKPYVGKRIEIKGIVAGAPKKHEKTGIVFDASIGNYPKYRSNVIETNAVPEPYEGAKTPIRFPEDATCITDVEGINEFKGKIEADHVNLQEDIRKLWLLKDKEEVFLSAVVREYKKGKGRDFCLTDIERIHPN